LKGSLTNQLEQLDLRESELLLEILDLKNEIERQQKGRHRSRSASKESLRRDKKNSNVIIIL
jgi:hypothetical protein